MSTIKILSELRSKYNCFNEAEEPVYRALSEAIKDSEPDEWCVDCKEYDQERHCCPRWNRVIRKTLEDAQPDRSCDGCKWRDTDEEWPNECKECSRLLDDHYER